MKPLNLLLLFVLSSNLLFGQFDKNREIVFTSLEEAMKTPDRIFYLNLSQQSLKVFPKEVLNFEKLIHLNLAHNEISSLEGIDLSSLKNLEEVILYDNHFRVFPYKALDSAPNLFIIDLGENDLKALSNEMNQFKFLEELILSGNRISETAKDIKLSHLKKVNLERNALAEFPEFIFHSPKLKYLNIYGNNLKEIPSQVNECSKLNFLNIGDNPIVHIAEDISLRKLKTLIFDWVDLSKQGIDIVFVAKSSLLETLSMEHCNLNQIPKEIFNLRRLKEFSILNNDLSEINEKIFSIRDLSKIWISRDNISKQDLIAIKTKMKKTRIILE